jgi:hypothetical protein
MGGVVILLSQELGSEECIQKFHYNNVHHVTEGDKVIWLFLQAAALLGQQTLMSAIRK